MCGFNSPQPRLINSIICIHTGCLTIIERTERRTERSYTVLRNSQYGSAPLPSPRASTGEPIFINLLQLVSRCTLRISQNDIQDTLPSQSRSMCWHNCKLPSDNCGTPCTRQCDRKRCFRYRGITDYSPMPKQPTQIVNWKTCNLRYWIFLILIDAN